MRPTPSTSRPRTDLAALPLLLALLAACGGGGGGTGPSAGPGPAASPTPGPSAQPQGPVLAAAGDIACDASTPGGEYCKQMETSDLLVELRPTLVLALGDIQYEAGRYEDFLRYYDVSWGRLRPITRPAPGNHEYQVFGDARGYFDYFNGIGQRSGVAGNRGEGWYSFDVPGWHIVSLNSNCSRVGGCGRDSPQERWLREDLRTHPVTCTLAFWHHPRFSSGPNGSTLEMQPIWETLQQAGADVILAGHEHSYERFAPLTATGGADAARGIREFVVGTGGRSLRPFLPPQPGSEVRWAEGFGVLRLELLADSYIWQYVPVAGSFRDGGIDRCH